MEIRNGDLNSPAVIALLTEHLESMRPTAPPESQHALDLDGLRGADIRFWCLWDGPVLAGFAALKHLSGSEAEIKSMRTAASHLRQGVASSLLRHLIEQATKSGYSSLNLETGSMAFFESARRLYRAFGFVECPPFADYRPDPLSTFMTLRLR